MSSPSRWSGLRLLTIVRLLWGATLLLAPGTIVGKPWDRRIGRPARWTARILGVRQLAEGAVTARRASHSLILSGAAVDAIHALSFVIVARVRPDQRRLALTNVTTASAFAVAGVAVSRQIHGDV